MKKILFPIVALLCLMACTEDLTEYYNRIDTLKAANEDLEREYADRDAENAEQEVLNAAQSARNAEREQWNAEQERRNREQETLKDSLMEVIGSMKSQRDDQIATNANLADRNAALAQYNSDLEEQNTQMRLLWDDLQQRLKELESFFGPRHEPKLLSMEFVPEDNQSLSQRVECKIVGDSVIECWLYGIVTNKSLIPRFTFQGTLVLIDGFEAESGKTRIDFARPRTVTVATQDKNQYYKIYVHSYTGLPVMYINTSGHQAVTSKDYYIRASMKLIEDARTRAAGDVIEANLNIKGRGNSSWKQPKKPYRLKFDEKVPLLDMHKDKSWVLINNYSDKSMVRNSVAFYMSSISNLDYTPQAHFVELIFNGSHQGTYLLCEKLKISNHRVAVGDDGFLMEIDSRARGESDSRFFEVSHMENVVNIKDPDVSYGDANYNYVRDFVVKADAALFSSNYKDKNSGWQKYIDMDSFVDWYLINEIGKNLDSNFDTSCYMNLKRGGKLKMGPVWDMDVAFGNIAQGNQTCFRTTGFYMKNVKWYARLFTDPAFVARVKERFNYFYRHKDDIMAYINDDAQYLRYSAEENDKKWGTLNVYTWTNYDIWGSYQNEVQSLKVWINDRMEWLKKQFDAM